MLSFNLKIAWRNLWKNKVFSIVNILGLAISLASCLVISLYVWNELHYDSFHKNGQHIYRITEKQKQGGVDYHVAVTPGPLAPSLKKDFPEISNTVRFGSWSGILKNGTNSYQEKNILLTENSVFSIFNFPLVKGNAATALSAPDEIVITETIAEKYFGKDWQNNPSLLGQVFRLNNEVNFKLAGIAKDLPKNSSIRFDILLPLSYLFTTDSWSNKWNSNNYHTYLEMKPGVNISAFRKKIARQLQQYNAESQDLLALQPLKDQYLFSRFDFNTDWGVRSNVKYVDIFAAVGLLLLIIACTNFINLSTARSLKRSLEVGVRKVNGATKKQLVLQFLTESVLVSLISAAVGTLLIALVKPYLTFLTGDLFSINIYSPLFAVFCLGLALVIGLLAGLYPAVVLSSFNTVRVIKGGFIGKAGKPLWRGMVVMQFVICIALLIGTAFMYRQLRFMQQKDLGFHKEQLISVRLNGALKANANSFKNELVQQPGVAGAAFSTMSMVNVDNSSYIEWEGMEPNDKFLITQANTDPYFIPLLGVNLLAGSNFSAQKPSDTANYIVNETAAKRMGYTARGIVGKQVVFWGARGTVIGVVKDFNFKSLNTSIEPFIFRYQPWAGYFTLFVKIAPGHTEGVLRKLASLYKGYEKEFPLELSFVNESIDKQYQEDTRTANLVLLFAGLTVFVGCLGLFGLTVFAAERRTQEIGIRKVLGARVVSLVGLLSRDFLKLVCAAAIIAIPIAWYLTTIWLRSFAYRITLDGWVFCVAGFTVLFVAFLTISIQSIKTAIKNPVKALRAE